MYDGVNAQPVTMAYDALFQTSVTDQKSQVYSAEHNALGWPTRQLDPLSAATTIRYDRRGLVTSTTNRRGQRVDMTYDNLGRILSKTGANTTSDYFSYSADRRITVAWNSVARDSTFYDPFSGADSTVTLIAPPSGGRAKRFAIYHSNNPNLGTPDTVTVSSSLGSPQRIYNWDGTTGALSSFAFAGQNPLTMTYNAEQLRFYTTFPNGSGLRRETYTSLHGVVQGEFTDGNLNGTFYRGYEYDDIGRVKTVLNGPSGATRHSYTYDNLGRLTGRVTDGNCSYLGESGDFGVTSSCGYTAASESFSYDQVGNRTDLGGVPGPANRMQQFNGAWIYHDADGNVVQKYKAGAYNREYWWSAESRLDSAYQDSWSKVKYDYDASGRPVRKWRGDPNSGWVFDRYWVWDGDQLVLALDPNTYRVEEYAYAPGIDRPIATLRGHSAVEGVGYHVQDELGNVIGITENGAVVSQAVTYDAWGVKSASGFAYHDRLFWKGLLWEDDVVSLYYMRNRWYDPETGRFMSEDPIGLAGGINMYTFANNDPVNGWDPYGLYDCWIIKGGQTAGTYANGVVTINATPDRFICPGGDNDGRPHGDGGGHGGTPGNPGGPGGGGRGTGSVNVSGDANRRIQNHASCAMASGMLVVTGVTDFTIVGPAARAGVKLGTRAFSQVVSGIGVDALRSLGYINADQYRRMAAQTWGAATAYSASAASSTHALAAEAVSTAELGLASGDLSGWDFVPYVATGRSFYKALRACT